MQSPFTRTIGRTIGPTVGQIILLFSVVAAHASIAQTPQTLIIDPVNRNIAYGFDADGDLLQSTDSGANWVSIANQPWGSAGQLFVDPSEPHRLFVAAADGLWLSADRGDSWTRLDVPASATTQMAFDVRAPSLLLAEGHQIYRSVDRGNTWFESAAFSTPVQGIAITGVLQAHALVDNSILIGVIPNDEFAVDDRFSGVEALDMVATYCGLLLRHDDGYSYARLFNGTEAAAPVEESLPESGRPVGVSRLARHGYDCDYLWSGDDGIVTAWAAQELSPGEELNGVERVTTVDFGAALLALQTAPFSYGDRYVVGLSHEGAIIAEPPEIVDTSLPACNASVNYCAYNTQVDRPGFFTTRVSLDENQPPTTWSLEFGSRSDTVNGFVGGAVLPADGGQPGFISFNQAAAGPIQLRLEEYTGQISEMTLELRRIVGGNRETIVGPLQLEPGDRFLVDSLAAGFYVVAVRSQPGDPTGRFGLELNGDDVELSGFGGRVEFGPQRSGFVGVFGTFTSLGLEYGAAQPRLSLTYLHPEMGRLGFFPREQSELPLLDADLTRQRDQFGNQRLHYAVRATSVSSDGRFLVIEESQPDRNYAQQPWLRWIDRQTGEQRVFELDRLRQDGLHVAGPHLATSGISLDGRKILLTALRFGTSTRQLVTIDAETAEVLQAVDFGTGFLPFSAHLQDGGGSVVLVLHDSFNTNSGAIVERVDLMSGERVPVAFVSADHGLGFTPVERRTAIRPDGLIGVIDPASNTLEIIDAQTGTTQRWPLSPPTRFSDTVPQIEDLSLHPDGAAVLLHVSERYGEVEGRVLSRIFEFNLNDETWLEIAPSDDPLAPHSSAPRYSADGEAIFFTREAMDDQGDGDFDFSAHQLIRADRQGGAARVLDASGFGIQTIYLGAEGQDLILQLRSGMVAEDDIGAGDVFYWEGR